MTIAPADIAAQRFRIAFRGYDVQEVDAFLDLLQAALTEVSSGAAGPTSDDAPPQRELAPGDGASAPAGQEADPAGSVRPEEDSSTRALRALLRAEQVAEQVVADATAEAGRIRAQAEVEREQLLAEARAESGRMEAEVRLQRERQIGALALRCEQLRAEVDRLGELRRRAREDLQVWLAGHQQLVDQGLGAVNAASSPPGPTLALETPIAAA